MQLRFLVLPLLLLTGWHASAQNDTPGFRDVMRFGVFGGPQFNFHGGTYEALDRSATCGICDFENGDLMKFRFEALLEIPFTPSLRIIPGSSSATIIMSDRWRSRRVRPRT